MRFTPTPIPSAAAATLDAGTRTAAAARQAPPGGFDAASRLLHGGNGAASQHDRITEQAQNWVAQTFFATLLKQMRDSPFKSDLFSGGQGGQAFANLYDQQLADRMSRSAGSKLVGSIVRRIEANAAYRQGSVGAGGGADNRKQGGAADESKQPARTNKEAKAHVAPALRA